MFGNDCLPDFCRRQWVSAQARDVWEPRISAIGQAFAAAERASVAAGIRSVALQILDPERFPELAQKAAVWGLAAVPLAQQGRAQEYAASPVERVEGQPWDYRLILSMPAKAARFLEAWRAGDDETIGRFLGYPKCCIDFFKKTWGAGSVDPTWYMGEKGDGPIEANILLRWLGVRCVPHMPCSFECEESVAMALAMHEFLSPEVFRWMKELLSMPMAWSSLYGVGEVVTPIVRINFRSDVSYELRSFRRHGSYYPEKGAHGIKFPYKPPAARQNPRLWTDNGFFSAPGMNEAHDMILEAMRAAPDGASVIDLGCGNGALLRKIGRGIGLEADPEKVKRAIWKGVRLGKIEDGFQEQVDVALISQRRFDEMDGSTLDRVMRNLESNTKNVLLYSYEEPRFAKLLDSREIRGIAR